MKPKKDEGEAPEKKKASRKKRRLDVDSIRGRVLYCLAALGFKRRHGRNALPSDLNREIPASGRGAKTYGAWNALRLGRNLPRHVDAPQGKLMTRLRELDAEAAASTYWPIWRLSSAEPLLLPEVHALMLQLRPGISHMLMGSFTNGRVLRWPTQRLTEIEWMVRENSLDGLTALIALMREAELMQNEAVFISAREAAFEQLPVLERRFGSAELSAEFSEFLKSRFAHMAHVFFGYEGPPTSANATGAVQVEPVDGSRELAKDLLELKWKLDDKSESDG